MRLCIHIVFIIPVRPLFLFIKGLLFPVRIRQLIHDCLDHGMHIRTPRIDNDIRNFTVKLFALACQLLDFLPPVSRLEQRAAFIVHCPLQDIVDRRPQINNRSSCLQVLPVFGVNDSTSSRCQNHPLLRSQLINRLDFATPETVFSLDFENPRHCRTGSCLDFMVGIDKTHTQLFCQQTSDCRFPRPHQTDQKDILLHKKYNMSPLYCRIYQIRRHGALFQRQFFSCYCSSQSETDTYNFVCVKTRFKG